MGDVREMRLIDAVALKKTLEEAGLGEHSLIESVLAAGVYAVIENAPTVDAVPVVRCRECKWCERFPISAYCNMWNSITKRNGFCHKGAKMDGGAE